MKWTKLFPTSCTNVILENVVWKMKHINNFLYIHLQFVVWRWKCQGVLSDLHLYIADVVISNSDCREIGWTWDDDSDLLVKGKHITCATSSTGIQWL